MKKIFTFLLFFFMPFFVVMGRDYNINDASVTLTTSEQGNGPIIIKGNGQSTTNKITVTSGVHDITLEGVNIDVSNIEKTCAFSIENGAKVNLTLVGENVLKSGRNRAGLQVPEKATLVITEESKGGSLDATGNVGAGIGGGYNQNAGTITINGGKVVANAGSDSAGIGGGRFAYGGAITITGGTVIADGGHYSDGIGDGREAGKEGVEPGEQSFTTGTDGTAIIYATNSGYQGGSHCISDQSGKGSWKGIIFEGENGQIYGDSYTVEEEKTLTIRSEHTLTISEDKKLINNGIIKIEYGGKINGDVSGKIKHELVYSMIRIGENKITYTGDELMPVEIDGYENDYTVNYENNTNAGEATATVKPTDDGRLYCDAPEGITKGFTIAPKSLEDEDAEVKIELFKEEFEYTGEEQIPEVKSVTVDGKLLVEGTDYTVTYSDDMVNAGPHKVMVKGIGNYTGEVETSYTITPKSLEDEDAEVKIELSKEEFEYTGEEQIPDVKSVTVDGRLLEGGTDYTVTYPNSIEVGDGYKITVTGKGNYSGFTSGTYKITPKSLENAAITFPGEKLVYTGEVQEPEVQVEDNGKPLEEHKDYTVTYPNSIEVGNTYTVTVTGQGNYSGEITSGTYEITPKSLDGATIELSPEKFVYTGGEQKPEIKSVMVDDKSLAGTNYTVAYSDDIVNVGSPEVIVNGTGNYTGETKASYEITPKPLTIAWTDATYEEGSHITPASIDGWITPDDADGSAITYKDKDGKGITLESLTAVGEYEITAAATIDNTNYEIPEEVTATITIKKRYVPPTPPVYYTITIPESIPGAIITGGGEHTVREYNSITFSIEIDPDGTGQYPTVTVGDRPWDTLTPDWSGTYRVYAYSDTEIKIGEVPGYTNYRLVLPTDSVFETDSTYWSAAGVEVTGMTALGNDLYEAPFGTLVTLTPAADTHRLFLEWEDGTRDENRTFLLRDDREIRALYRKVFPVSNEVVSDGMRVYAIGSTLYICTTQKTSAIVCTPAGRVIYVGEIEGERAFYGLPTGVYMVNAGGRSFKLMIE